MLSPDIKVIVTVVQLQANNFPCSTTLSVVTDNPAQLPPGLIERTRIKARCFRPDTTPKPSRILQVLVVLDVAYIARVVSLPETSRCKDFVKFHSILGIDIIVELLVQFGFARIGKSPIR